jgi:hypothetical protein
VGPGLPSIGVDDSGKVYVAFASLEPGGGGPSRIWFTKAVDSADTNFLPPRIVSDIPTTYYRVFPSLVVKPNGNTYIAYQSDGVDTFWTKRDIYVIKSTDRGRTFAPRVRVTDIRPHGPDAREPSIAADRDSGVYVAWYENRWGGWNGFFAASTNGGDSFGPSVLIEDTSVSPTAYRVYQNLAVNANTGTAYVIWGDERNNPRAAGDIYSAKGVFSSGVSAFTEVRRGLFEVKLGAIWPNPMREQATILYELPAKGKAQLVIYNVVGQRVCTLREGVIEGGKHEERWDGRDERGKEVRNGIYFVSLEAETGKVGQARRLIREVVKVR